MNDDCSTTPCAGPSGNPLLPIWTPADGAALRALADQFPCEVGQSDFLAYLVEREGISL